MSGKSQASSLRTHEFAVSAAWICVFGGNSSAASVAWSFWRGAQIPLLEFLDICSPAACVGYGIGRIGVCFPAMAITCSHFAALGHELSQWRRAYHAACPSTPLYGNFHLVRHRPRSFGHMGTKSLRSRKPAARFFAII